MLQAGKVVGERKLQRRVVGPAQRPVGVDPVLQLARIHDRKAFEPRTERITEGTAEQATSHPSPPCCQLRVPVPSGHGAESGARL